MKVLIYVSILFLVMSCDSKNESSEHTKQVRFKLKAPCMNSVKFTANGITFHGQDLNEKFNSLDLSYSISIMGPDSIYADVNMFGKVRTFNDSIWSIRFNDADSIGLSRQSVEHLLQMGAKPKDVRLSYNKKQMKSSNMSPEFSKYLHSQYFDNVVVAVSIGTFDDDLLLIESSSQPIDHLYA